MLEEEDESGLFSSSFEIGYSNNSVEGFVRCTANKFTVVVVGCGEETDILGVKGENQLFANRVQDGQGIGCVKCGADTGEGLDRKCC